MGLIRFGLVLESGLIRIRSGSIASRNTQWVCGIKVKVRGWLRCVEIKELPLLRIPRAERREQIGVIVDCGMIRFR